MYRNRWVAILVISAPLVVGACGRRDAARADSLQALKTRQDSLMTKLAAQKDSLTGVVIDADQFIAKVDSQITSVKGVRAKGSKQTVESPIQQQILDRKAMLERVDALVKRTKLTANELAEARKSIAELKGEVDRLGAENAQLKTQSEQEQQMIASLQATIERQTQTINQYAARVDSLNGEMKTLGSKTYRAYYVIGTEKELLAKHVIEREGGANLLIAHPGRTIQPARALDSTAFTVIDQRDIREITVPDTSRRYQVVSRQSLDAAEVHDRDNASFRGNLKIADSEKFWGPSRYLILVQR